MASIDKRPDGRYRARWREYPGGPQKTKSFARQIDAKNFLTEIEHSRLRGTYVDPAAGRITVAQYATAWVDRRRASWRPRSLERFEGELARWILPAFGTWPIASVKRAHIEQWAAGLPLAPSSSQGVVKTLRTMLSAAVDDEILPRNPAAGARLPALEQAPVVPLTSDQVRALINAAPVDLRAAFVLAAGTGLRQGEAMSVTVDRVDFLRRELRVDRQLATPPNGPAHFVPPKSRRSYRTIALSTVVVDALAAHLATYCPGRDGLLFHHGGEPIRRQRLGDVMRSTAKAAEVDASWHDFRHAHASVLLSAGISPALVADRLGHSLIELLRTYAHVIRSDEDRVRAIVDAGLQPAEDQMRTAAAREGALTSATSTFP
jgi:integrase